MLTAYALPAPKRELKRQPPPPVPSSSRAPPRSRDQARGNAKRRREKSSEDSPRDVGESSGTVRIEDFDFMEPPNKSADARPAWDKNADSRRKYNDKLKLELRSTSDMVAYDVEMSCSQRYEHPELAGEFTPVSYFLFVFS